MSNTSKIAIVSGVVLLFVLLLYYFSSSSQEEKPIENWFETYSPDDKGPYGTYILKELLDTAGLFGNFIQMDEEINDALIDNPRVNDIYFFVGKINHLSEKDAYRLIDFLTEGNTVFMACEFFPESLMNKITTSDNLGIAPISEYDTTQYFKFIHSNLKSKRYASTFIYNNETTEKNWEYFDLEDFRTDHYQEQIVLGTNTKEKCNFLKIKYGYSGTIFLHSTPYLFTNISLVKRNGFQYAEKVLEHIPPGRVQWDVYNLNPNDGNKPPKMERRQSILQFILEHTPLVWALILLLSGALLYAIFKGKRMQKIIPATESKQNTSLAYISTLSSLYLQENKHYKLIRLKEKTFINFIAEHYYISSAKPDATYFEKVAIKSQLPKEKIAEIFTLFKQLEQTENVSDEQLIQLHKKIEYFYKNCR